MNTKNILITFKKELRGVVRDKKSFLTMLLLPLIIPVYIFAMGFLFEMMGDSASKVGTNYEIYLHQVELLWDNC